MASQRVHSLIRWMLKLVLAFVEQFRGSSLSLMVCEGCTLCLRHFDSVLHEVALLGLGLALGAGYQRHRTWNAITGLDQPFLLSALRIQRVRSLVEGGLWMKYISRHQDAHSLADNTVNPGILALMSFHQTTCRLDLRGT
jgi:hypothetical protein